MAETIAPIRVCNQCCKLEGVCDLTKCGGSVVDLYPHSMLEAGNGLVITMDGDGEVSLVEPLDGSYVASSVTLD